MKTIKFLYFSLLILATFGLLFFMGLGTLLEYERITAQRAGTWDSSMGGAGMAMIAPFILTAIPFVIANIFGVLLLILNRSRKSLKHFEKIVIIVCGLLLIGYIPVLMALSHLLTIFAGLLAAIS